MNQSITPQWLRERIAATGARKQDVARECGVHPSMVTHWLNGFRPVLPRYADILREMLGGANHQDR